MNKRNRKNQGDGYDQTVPNPNLPKKEESMGEIFDLKTTQTFSKEPKRTRLQDAWGKKK